MPNFKEDPEGYGSAFKMKGHTLPGPFQQTAAKQEVGDPTATNKNEQQAVRDAQGGPVEGGPLEQKSLTPPPGWRAERQEPAGPSAPEAASLDYVNPVEGGPIEQRTEPSQNINWGPKPKPEPEENVNNGKGFPKRVSPMKQNGYGDNQGFKGGMYNIDNMPKPQPGDPGSPTIGTGTL